MLKLKMMLCVMMLPLVVVGCTSKQSVSQCVKLPPPPAWICALTGRHRWTGLFHLREADHLCKNNWKEPRSILMSSADRALISMGNSCNYCIIHTRFQRSINAQSNKTEQSIYECLLGFCFNNISAPPQILAASTVFFFQFQKRRNDGWWLPLVLLLPVCFEQ